VKASNSDSVSRLKAILAGMPLLGRVACALSSLPVVKKLRELRHRFRSSSSYWEQRYRRGGTSGAGSFGRLAEFKADTLNGLVARMGIESVIEFGCGDGAQLSLAAYPRYVGIDVARSSISACRRRFAGDATKRFYLTRERPADLGRFDLVLSLDVIYHLVEDNVFDDYLHSLFAHAGRFVVIYSSNKFDASDAPHIRHRLFTSWIETHAPQWRKTGYLPNKYPFDPAQPAETSFADFYFFGRF
jgi:cyclopropane fatty-acyl-phospholipid synthase-like methyltransferase